MPNGVDFYMQNGSTEFKVLGSTGNMYFSGLTPASSGHEAIDSSGNILLGSSGKLFSGSTDSTNLAIDSSGQLSYKGIDLGAVQIMTSGVGSSAAQITGYGVTIHQGDTGTSLQMAAPAYVGARKTLIFLQGSSIARTIDSTNTTGSTGNDRGWSFWSTASTNSTGIVLTTGSTLAFSLELIAPTTVQWAVMPGYSSDAVEYTLATT